MEEILKNISKIENQLALLPKGFVSIKEINGKKYFYLRVMENGKRIEKYIPNNNVEKMKEDIEKRKQLEKELKNLKKMVNIPSKVVPSEFLTNVNVGDKLSYFCNNVKKYKKRFCYKKLYDYLKNDETEKVFILYGLRRTGKTTMIRQAILDLINESINNIAFIQITPKDTLASLKQDLRILEKNGYKYIFIDEVTLLEDFIEGAAVLSDLFASCGMKIVLSGTDSLGFIFSKDESLFDRCDLLHTTFISYKEFEEVLGIVGIDEYIKYGGTMSLGGIHYNENSTFANIKKVDEYVDSAIAKNIQHSLKYYQDGGHFRNLFELYEKNELTNAINRVVEDINHRFTLEVINKVFKSNDLSISARNLRRDENVGDILDKINIKEATNRLKTSLDIKDVQEMKIEISKIHIGEIKEYLELLDLLYNVKNEIKGEYWTQGYKTVFTQPGIRYAQTEALIQTIMLDREFQKISLDEKTIVIDRILNEIKGRMVEDIILLETSIANPKKDIFKCQFDVGEFDMVIADNKTKTCEIFEIKHSNEIISNQFRHLLDDKKCKDVEFRFGKIISKNVLYRGKDSKVNEINYINIEKYLCLLDC